LDKFVKPFGTFRRCLGVVVLGIGVIATAQAQDSWVVRDFRVVGAQRISEGTVFNYLPINVGDTMTPQLVQEAMRAVYSTGFFRDVELRRDGDTLVIAVLERPSIEDFTIEGNQDIETEVLESSLREVGLARGRVFDQSVLDDVAQALTEQYFSQGKYAVKIETPIEELPDNRVRVGINIEEGDRAEIQQINIVGNTSFDDETLLDQFAQRTRNWLSWIRQDNRYAKQALEGDLEALRAYYMDRGYADFRLDGVQVAISPDKRDIFITVNITEGDLYTVSDVRLAGEMVVPEDELRAEIDLTPGQVFSQRSIASTEVGMSARLSAEGYAFAQIQSVPELDYETREVDITFFINPQSRVYVRRINFNGTDSVNDEVFRREMVQLEGSYLSNTLLETSQIRLQRLPYVDSAEFETIPVPGSPDLVDVEWAIEEGLPGQFGGSLGYSQTYGVTLGGNFIHSNFMGTGNRVATEITGGEFAKLYNVNYTDAYRTIDGMSRTLSFSYRDISQFTSGASDFSTETFAIGADWNYPITLNQYLRFGFSLQQAELATGFFSSAQAAEWVTNNGTPFEVPGSDGRFFGTQVQSLELTAGWIFDSRNRFLFPDSGTRIGFSLSATAPGSDAEYYVTRFDFTKYFPLFGDWLFRINSRLSFGDAYGEKTTALPPFRNFFGGGPGSVRGYKESWLGPRDSLRNPYGGNALFATQFELIIPTPEAMAGSARISLFYDVGNVFSTGGVSFFDKLGDPVEYDFNYDNLKQSIGLAVEWLAPMGLLTFSYGVPLNNDAETDRFFGDETEEFQFRVGNAF
jgi:outer membrane protein insertion porin family